jgi:alpha-glucosidase
VEAEQKDPHSILNFYRKLIQIRKNNEVMVYGAYDLVLPEHQQVYAYTRTLGTSKVLVISNLTKTAASCDFVGMELNSDKLMLQNYEVPAHGATTKLELRPFEARMYRLS